MRRALLAIICAGACLAVLGMTRPSAIAQVLPTQTPASSFMPLVTPSPQVGPPMAVDNVLADSMEYDGKPVQATGIVQNLRTDDTGRGSILQFDLCGRHCIHVLDVDNPSISDGATTTISGTFHKHFSRGRFSQDDLMLVVPSDFSQDDNSDRHQNMGRRWPPP